MQSLIDAAGLRRLADALDRLSETTTQTGVTLCAYGTDHIEVDGITLALQSQQDGDSTRYVVDLSGQ
ncbi:hypothetical protein ACF09I_34515 [Streptomyces sp. NPDC014940]|uniref:hypothetical protein n=1 Tax=Streptomyces sp. NPDC014940 TaxID=3364932 RepID=UPI003701BBA5